jgi:uncharacterized protein (DUF1697 family)
LRLALHALHLAAQRRPDTKSPINSGNAVFTSRFRSPQQHQSSTAAALQQSQGVTTSVIVKSATPRSAMQAASPIDSPEAEHSRFLVALAGDA